MKNMVDDYNDGILWQRWWNIAKMLDYENDGGR